MECKIATEDNGNTCQWGKYWERSIKSTTNADKMTICLYWISKREYSIVFVHFFLLPQQKPHSNNAAKTFRIFVFMQNDMMDVLLIVNLLKNAKNLLMNRSNMKKCEYLRWFCYFPLILKKKRTKKTKIEAFLLWNQTQTGKMNAAPMFCNFFHSCRFFFGALTKNKSTKATKNWEYQRHKNVTESKFGSRINNSFALNATLLFYKWNAIRRFVWFVFRVNAEITTEKQRNTLISP